MGEQRFSHCPVQSTAELCCCQKNKWCKAQGLPLPRHCKGHCLQDLAKGTGSSEGLFFLALAAPQEGSVLPLAGRPCRHRGDSGSHPECRPWKGGQGSVSRHPPSKRDGRCGKEVVPSWPVAPSPAARAPLPPIHHHRPPSNQGGSRKSGKEAAGPTRLHGLPSRGMAVESSQPPPHPVREIVGGAPDMACLGHQEVWHQPCLSACLPATWILTPQVWSVSLRRPAPHTHFAAVGLRQKGFFFKS